ncbi:MAG: hypothetical protein ISR58_12850 [Anaerolineales bacterium]|nr:hypothetical protein [Anaerolineales bacterium]
MNSKLNTNSLFIILIIVLLAALACGGTQDVPPVVKDQPIETPSLPTVVIEEPTEQRSQAQEGDILFQDDFQDGQSDGWDVTAAWFVQQSGDIYTFDASGSGGAWVPTGSNWSNYAYQSSIRLDAGSLLLGFNLSQSGRYYVRLDGSGLFLLKEYPAKNYTVLIQTGPVTLGEWHLLDLRSYNGHIQVYVDEALWVDYTDTSPLSKGSITVTSQEGSQVSVEDVLVTTTGPLTKGVVQAPQPQKGQPELDVESAVEDDGLTQQQIVLDDQQEVGDQVQEEQQDESQEELQDQVPSGQPDLVVLEATFDPDPVVSGQPFTSSFVIQNQGDAPAGAFTLLWKFHAATGIGVCSWDYDSLAAGESVWGGCSKTTNAQPGQSPTVLTIDFENEIEESDDNNNVLTPALYVITTAQDSPGEADAALPDLMVGAMAFTDRNFRCDLVNYGQGTAPAGVRVTLYANGNRIGWQETSGPLPSGASVTFNIPVDLTLEEINKARCIADRGNSFEEENEDNNEFVWVQE